MCIEFEFTTLFVKSPNITHTDGRRYVDLVTLTCNLLSSKLASYVGLYIEQATSEYWVLEYFSC